MKAKYYMRGIGLGMMLIAGGMLAAGIPSNQETLSKEEIVEAAKQYGLAVTEEEMEENEDHLNLEGIVGSSDKSQKEEEETLEKEEDSESDTDFIEESSDLEANPEEGREVETIETEANTEDSAENSTEEDTNTNRGSVEEDGGLSEVVREYAIIEVTVDMYGVQFAHAAYQAGLISNEAEFIEYMAVNRYDKDMRTGVYQIKIGSTYEEICKVVTTRGN